MRRFASIIPLFLIAMIMFSYIPPVRADNTTWMMNTGNSGVNDTVLRKSGVESAFDSQVLYHNNKYYFAYTGQGTTAYVWVFDNNLNYAGRYDISPGWQVGDICVFRVGDYIYAAVGKYGRTTTTSEYPQVSIYRLLSDGTVAWIRTVNIGGTIPNTGVEYTNRVYPVRDASGSTVYLLFGFYATSYASARIYYCDANNGFSAAQILTLSSVYPGASARFWAYYSSNVLYWFDGRFLYKYAIGGSAVQLYDRGSYPNGQMLTHMVYYNGDANFIFRFYMQNDNDFIVLQARMTNGVLNTLTYTLRSDVQNILVYNWNNPQSSYLDTIIVQTTANFMIAQSIMYDSLYNFQNTSATFLSEMTIPLTLFNPLRISYSQSGIRFYTGLYVSQSQFLISVANISAPPVPPSGGSGTISMISGGSNRKILFYRELDNTYTITHITVQISSNASGTIYAYTGESGVNLSLIGSKSFNAGNQTITLHTYNQGRVVAVLFKFNSDYEFNYSGATYKSYVMYTDNYIESYLKQNLNDFIDITDVDNPLVGVTVFIPPTNQMTGYVGNPTTNGSGGGGAGGQYFNYTLWFIVNNMTQPNNYDINRNNTIPQALQGVKLFMEGYGMPWNLFGLIVFAACCFTAAFSLSKHNVADPRLILFFVTILGYVLFAAGVVDFVVPALCTIALIGVSAMAVSKQFGGGGGGDE